MVESTLSIFGDMGEYKIQDAEVLFLIDQIKNLDNLSILEKTEVFVKVVSKLYIKSWELEEAKRDLESCEKEILQLKDNLRKYETDNSRKFKN